MWMVCKQDRRVTIQMYSKLSLNTIPVLQT